MADEIIDNNIPQEDPFSKYGGKAIATDNDPFKKYGGQAIQTDVKKNASSTIPSSSTSLDSKSISQSDENKTPQDFDINTALGKPIGSSLVRGDIANQPKVLKGQPSNTETGEAIQNLQKAKEDSHATALLNTAKNRLKAKGLPDNSGNVVMEMSHVKKDVENGDLGITYKNGEPYYGTIPKWYNEAQKGFVNTISGISDMIDLASAGTDAKKRADIQNQINQRKDIESRMPSYDLLHPENTISDVINAQKDQTPMAEPTAFGKVAGMASGLVPYMVAGEAGIPAKVIMAISQTAPNEFGEMYNKYKENGEDDATASSHAARNIFRTAPDAVLNYMLMGEGGGKLPTEIPAAKNLLNTISEIGKSATKMGLKADIADLAKMGIETMQGEHPKDIADRLEGKFGSWFLNDALVRGLPMLASKGVEGIANAPKYLKSAIKEYATRPEVKPIVEEHLKSLPNGDEIKSELDQWEKDRKPLEGIVPEEKMTTVNGLNQQVKSLKEQQNKLPELLKERMQPQIDEVNSRIEKVVNSSRSPIRYEIDEKTGSKIQQPTETTKPIEEEVNQPIGETKTQVGEGEIKPKENVSITPQYETANVGTHEGKEEFGLKENGEIDKKQQTDTKKQQVANISKWTVPLDADENGNGGKGDTMAESVGRVISEYIKDKSETDGKTAILTHSSVLKMIKTYEGLKDKPLFKDADWNKPETFTPEQVKEFTDSYNSESTNNGDVESFDAGNGKQIHIARHGQTEDNLTGKFRTPETLLTDKGREQAKEVGQKLKDLGVEKIKSSDYPRAVETSNIAMDEINKPTESKPETPPNPPIIEDKTITNGEGNGNKVGVSHNALKALAQKLGLKEPERGKRLSPEEMAYRGRLLYNAGADVEQIAKDFKEGTQHSSDAADAISVVRAHIEDLAKIADSMNEKWGSNSRQFEDAKNEVAKWINISKEMGTAASEPFTALQGSRDLTTDSFTGALQEVEKVTGTKANKVLTEKIKELTENNAKLKIQIEEADKKLIDATNSEIGKQESKKTFTERAKKAADTFRKLKQKEFTFKDENGNDIPLTKMGMGVSWNDLVEVGAKAIEESGKIADGIAAIIEKIKDTDFYKNSSDTQKEQLEKQLSEHYKAEAEKTPEAKNIKRLEKELEDLQKGIAKQHAPKRELTEREKELQEKIRDEKEKLGLIPSKMEKPLTETEQKEQLEKQLSELQKNFVDKKDSKFTPDEAKQIWDYAQKRYLSKGDSYVDAITKTADDIGLTVRQTAMAVISPKTEKIALEQWKRQYDLRRGRRITEDYIESQNRSPLFKIWKKISSIPRSITVAFHGHVFGGTHYPMGLLTPTDWHDYFRAIANMAKASYGDKGKYEMFLRSIENDKNYPIALKAGLKVDVNDTKTDDFEKPSTLFGEKAKTLSEVGTRGFAGLKDLRLRMWSKYWDRLPENEKTDEVAETLSYLMNVATGASNNKIPTVLQEGLFSAPMESARWGRLFKSPALAADAAIRIMKSLKNSEEPRPQDKVFLKVWGSRVGQQLAMYAGAITLASYMQNTLFPNNKINLTDPTKSDYFKFKIGNTTIGLDGGTLGIIQLLSSLYQYTQKGKTRQIEEQTTGRKILKYGLSKASPIVGDIAELGLGTDFSGNPLPFSNKVPPSYGHKLTYGEYFGSKSPIFISGTIDNIFKSAEDNGLNKTKTEAILNGLLQFGATAGIGLHAKESFPSDNTGISDTNSEEHKLLESKGLGLVPYSKYKLAPVTPTGKDIPVSDPQYKEFTKAREEYFKQDLSKLINGELTYTSKDNKGKPPELSGEQFLSLSADEKKDYINALRNDLLKNVTPDKKLSTEDAKKINPDDLKGFIMTITKQADEKAMWKVFKGVEKQKEKTGIKINPQ